MGYEISDMTELAHEGSTQPLTTTPVVGTPVREYESVLHTGAGPVAEGELRVTVLGSGDPFVKRSQASASILVEVGNPQQDVFFFDLGSGSLANFNGLRLPVTATTKVFLTHLHADHVGDMPTLVWSMAKSGRRDPVEVWVRPPNTGRSAPAPTPRCSKRRTHGIWSRSAATPASRAPR